MIRNISVIGAGTMGLGITIAFAMNDFNVNVYIRNDNVRSKFKDKIRNELVFLAEEDIIRHDKIDSILDNITTFGELKPAAENADFVMEAVKEDLDTKKALFAELDKICPPHTIFASNTSSLPLKAMTQELPEARRARTMVCHWYNPAHVIPIAELSYFGNMEEEVFNEVYELHIRAGKQPVKVLKDIPGLIANRMLHAMAREIFYLVEIGAASPEDIDRALRFGPGFRSAASGILETADMGGLDVWCAVEDNLFKELNSSTKASNFLREKVQQGKLGLKSGEGFYAYPDGDGLAKKDFNKRLLAQLKVSKENQRTGGK